MMMSKKQPRTRKGARRLDLTAMKEALRDGKCWSCFGLVAEADDKSKFQLDGDDLLVDVEVQPSGERITARVGTAAGGAGRGVWVVPKIGSEVVVLVPDGDLGFMPTVVAVLSTGEVSGDLDEDNLILVNGAGDIDVVPSGDVSLGIKDATEQALRGNAFQTTFNNLVTQFNALVAYIAAHTHTGVTSGPSTSGGPASAPTQVGIPSAGTDLSPNVKVK